jgi:segregation and condensation protein A
MTGILRRLQSAVCRVCRPVRSVAAACRWWWSTFVALLELGKETLIEITQAEPFAPIYVRLAYSPA